MNTSFLKAVENRRSYYAISSECPISDDEVREIIATAVKYAPSAFNSQSSRVVLLLGEEHKALWKIVMDSLKERAQGRDFTTTEAKINSFAAGHGTVLFFEDQDTVKSLQEQFTSYAQNFPVWSEHHSGIVQFIVWTALEDAGLGASLQHYNPLIDDKVKEKWGLSPKWKLTAQMPFGKIEAAPQEKEFMPIEQRFLVFG